MRTARVVPSGGRALAWLCAWRSGPVIGPALEHVTLSSDWHSVHTASGATRWASCSPTPSTWARWSQRPLGDATVWIRPPESLWHGSALVWLQCFCGEAARVHMAASAARPRPCQALALSARTRRTSTRNPPVRNRWPGRRIHEPCYRVAAVCRPLSRLPA